MDETWMLDELAHAGPEHLDEGFIAGFDRKQGYPDPEADIAAFEAHGLGDRSTVVDFGAGTGQFAIPAAARFGRVIAVDVSAAMLGALRAKARATAGEAGLSRLECVRGGFLSYCPAGPVDGVYTRNALHQLPDFWKVTALRRIAGLLRPGGVLRLVDLVYDFGPAETDAVFADWFANAATDPAAGLHRRRLRGAHPHRAQHLPLAPRADARRDGIRSRRRQLRTPPLRRLHLRQGPAPRQLTGAG